MSEEKADNQELQTRKATDILLALEEKINLLQKTVTLYDFNLKIVLDRVNKILAYQEKNKLPEISITPSPSAKEVLIEAGPSKLELATKPIVNNRRAPSAPLETTESSNVSLDTRWYNGKKIPIQQIVKDQHGRDIFMADVSIFTIDDKLMHSTRTTAVGKWQHLLAWGKYKVKISKKDPNDPNKIYEISQEIFIPENSSPFKLKDITLNR